MKDDVTDHRLQLIDEGLCTIVSALNLTEFAFPDAGEFGRFEKILMNGGDEFTAGVSRKEALAFTADVAALEERLDDGGAGGRTSYAVFFEGVAKFLVINKLACRFHCPQKGCFRVGFWRSCPGFFQGWGVRPGLPFHEVWHYLELGTIRCVLILRLPIRLGGLRLCADSWLRPLLDCTPARLKNLLAGGFKLYVSNLAENRCGRNLAIWIKLCNETAGHKVIDHHFLLGKVGGRDSCRDNRVVVSDFGIVEDSFAFRQLFASERIGELFVSHESLKSLRDLGVDVVAEESRVHARIGGNLLFVEGLNEFEGLIGTESEALVALNLKRGEVEKTRGKLLTFLL